MPKTIRNKYDEAVTFDKLLEAHKKARRGKREKKKVIELDSYHLRKSMFYIEG